jgi:predicted homoserine dehydrogenase-like protein
MQACVNYIRQKGLGVATFVILKQQQERWAHKMGAIATPRGGCCNLTMRHVPLPSYIASLKRC